ncbi:MAG: hypothetical protein ABSD74_05495 [Rhizomicrobium sp.]|jgi:hypothetical protein
MIKQLQTEMNDNGIIVFAAVIPAGNTALPEKFEDILGAHARIHAAEGFFYRATPAPWSRANRLGKG